MVENGTPLPARPHQLKLGIVTKLGVFTEPSSHKLNNILWHLARQSQEPLQHALRLKGTVRKEERRFFPDAFTFTVVNAVMDESSPDFPEDSVLVAVFSVSQLKSHRPAVVTKPY